MNSEVNFGDSIPRDDLLFRDMTDHSLSLPTIGIQFSNKTKARTCDVIDRSMTTSSYEQICGSVFIVKQHSLVNR
jgi:hypothetical protein